VKKCLYILFLLPLAFIFSCKTKKHISPKPERCKLDHKSAKTLTHHLKQNQAYYITFTAKAKANVIIDDKATEFTVALRIKKDSIIWASISIMGIEGIRFVATKDSIKFIQRGILGQEGKYFVGRYDTLANILRTDIDLEILQSLLLGNNVEFYEEDERVRSGIDSCRYILSTIHKRKFRKMIEKGKELKEPAQIIWIHDSSFKITRILFREFESNREFDAHFSNFTRIEDFNDPVKQTIIPFVLTYYIKADKIIIVNLEYTKVSVNKPQNFPFVIPEGYERIGN
jgi:hypothetical protein